MKCMLFKPLKVLRNVAKQFVVFTNTARVIAGKDYTEVGDNLHNKSLSKKAIILPEKQVKSQSGKILTRCLNVENKTKVIIPSLKCLTIVPYFAILSGFGDTWRYLLDKQPHKFKAAVKTVDEYQSIKKLSWAILFIFLLLSTIILYSLKEGAPLPGPLSAMLIFCAIFSLGFYVVCLVSLKSKKGHVEKLAKNTGWLSTPFFDELNPHSVGLNATSLMELTPLDVRSITSEKFIVHTMQEKAVNQSLKGLDVSEFLKKIPVLKKILSSSVSSPSSPSASSYSPSCPTVRFKNVATTNCAPGKKKKIAPPKD